MATNADASVIIEADFNVSEANKKLKALQKNIEKTEAEINKKQAAQSGIVKELDKAFYAAYETEKRVKALRAELEKADAIIHFDKSGLKVNMDEQMAAKEARTHLAAALAEQEKLFVDQKNQVEKLADSVKKYEQEIEDATRSIDIQKETAGELVQKIVQAEHTTKNVSKATKKAEASMGRFAKRLSGVVSSALVFTVISQGLAVFREWLGKTIKTNNDAAAAIAGLRSALYNLAQPIMSVVIPAFITLVNILTRVINTISNIVSWLFGSTAKSSTEAAEGLYEEADAMGAVGGAAKKAEKSLASFDEINQLSSPDSGGGGGGGGGAAGSAPDFSGVVSGALSGIAELFTGLALMALGAVLTFTGANIPVGLAMMVAGALVTYHAISTDPTLAASLVENSLGAVMAVISAGLLVIGAILAFSGANIGLGIALMVIGAAGLAAVAAINWDSVAGPISENINEILSITSGALLVLGAIFAFSGANLGLGIGLMIAGAAGMVAVAALNWDTVSEALHGPVGDVITLISGALLALGALLAFTGANVGLGIGLLAVGSVGLAAVAVVNMDTINQLLRGPIGKVTALVSGALLVLGAILAFSGARIGLGIGLMAAGAVGLAKVATVNWDSIVSILRGKVGGITALVGASLLALGAILLLSGASPALGLGLLVAGGASIVAAIAPNWDFLLDMLKESWAAIESWWDENIAPIFTAQWWGDLAKSAMNGLISGIERGLNAALGGVGSFVNKIIGVLNKIPGVSIDSVSWGNVQLPRLAEGAVIPPNREFMAVLGDQKSGNNIEAPESLIRRIVREETGGFGGSGSRDITIVMELNGREFGRAVYRANSEESQRVGVSLAGVKA